MAHLARLARLALTPAEEAALAGHLTKMLDYVAVLGQLEDAGDAAPPPPSEGPRLRADEVGPSLAPAAALKNAPARAGDGFAVPAVLGE